MSRSYAVVGPAGVVFVNETGTRSYAVAVGAYVNETTATAPAAQSFLGTGMFCWLPLLIPIVGALWRTAAALAAYAPSR